MTYANYNVGLKVLLHKGGEILALHPHGYVGEGEVGVLRDGVTSHRELDFPGGRIDANEHDTALKEVIAREVREEVGDEVRYELGDPVFVARRYIAHRDLHVFLVFYEAKYLGGDIVISDEHIGYEWIDLTKRELHPEGFNSAEEFEALKKYLSKQHDKKA